MIKKLPGYYRKSQVVADLYAVISAALSAIAEDVETEDLNLFITTTSDFTKHEKDVGILPLPAPAETRRARVIARIRGNNLLTPAELTRLIETYESEGCVISEDFENYTVTITLSCRGIPDNIDKIKTAVEEVKPAHICVEYAYTENTLEHIALKFGRWGDIPEGMTWEDLSLFYRSTVYLNDDDIPYQSEIEKENAIVEFDGAAAYARRL